MPNFMLPAMYPESTPLPVLVTQHESDSQKEFPGLEVLVFMLGLHGGLAWGRASFEIYKDGSKQRKGRKCQQGIV